MRPVAIAVLLGACGSVEVRVCNRTGHGVTDVEASVFIHRDLADGECTEYVEAEDDVYRYTYARFLIGADVFLAQPIDFVGETPLGPGRWSYELKIRDMAQRYASADVVKD